MIRFAVTVSLVEQARGGPFVFWDDLRTAFQEAERLGFDAVEIFAPDGQAVNRDELRRLIDQTGVKVAAVGTGAGMVVHQLQLTDPDAKKREQALRFVQQMIEFGAEFDAPAIIGSMQGRFRPEEGKAVAVERLAASLRLLSDYAGERGVRLIYEPLNRYETNLFHQLGTAADFVKQAGLNNVVLLADLFHMNIEERDLGQAFREADSLVGHIHFVDSNRQAAGWGHLDFQPIVQALQETGYQGYVSAEAFPLPNPVQAAEKTIQTYKKLFPVKNFRTEEDQ